MIQGWNHVSNEICQQITNEDTKQAINELSHGIYDYALTSGSRCISLPNNLGFNVS